MNDSINHLINGPAGKVWHYFQEISNIPRPSKREDKVIDYILKLADAREWEYKKDAVNNIAISIPGKGKLKDASTLIIQGHMDMVCEKNRDIKHDFMNDPIHLVSDEHWVMADGTTLGADNGIALGMMLALTHENFTDCLPLELLFTIDEETGLTGAMQLTPSLLNGKMLLNIDSEGEGVFTIGCAGGIDISTSFNLLSTTHKKPDNKNQLEVFIHGLRGGHSGISIHENRKNAIRCAGILLERLRDAVPDIVLLNLSGGNKKNAIPRESTFTISGIDKHFLETESGKFLAEIKNIESDAELIVREISKTYTKMIPLDVIEFINQIPNGVISMDPNYPDIVQTSSNLAVATVADESLEILMHSRSTVNAAIEDIEISVDNIASKLGANTTSGHRYSGWNPNPDTQILNRGMQIYKMMYKADPKVCSIHAGLECGVIGDKIKSDELLSIGPTIENAHSPTERVNIQSTNRVYEFLKQFVSSVDCDVKSGMMLTND